MTITKIYRGIVLGWAIGFTALLGGACVDLTPPPSLRSDAGGDTGGGGGTGGSGGTAGAGGIAGGGGADAAEEVRDGAAATGQPCQAPDDCASNFCVDGYCCNSACGRPCETCAARGGEGTCRSFEAGTDPKNACTDDGAMTCGHDGMCDGAGACRFYDSAIACRALSCAGSSLFTSRCNGAGACVPSAATSCYPYVCASATMCRKTCATGDDCMAPAACFVGSCGGLTATYYDNSDFTGRAVTRIEREIDFDWGNGSPAVTIGNDTFSARWVGRLTPPFTGNYVIYAASDDGVRVWIDDRLVLQNWRVQPLTETAAIAPLTAGKTVSIKVEYYDEANAAIMRLAWSLAPQLPKQIIPVTALMP